MPHHRLTPLALSLLLTTALPASAYAADTASTPARASTPSATATGLAGGMDLGVMPGDDFDGYANGGWLKSTDIPADKSRWGVVGEVAELTNQRVLKLVVDAASQPVGSPRAKDAAFVREQDRLFFTAYGQSWRTKTREATLRLIVTTDGHAPENFRAATVRNLDAWYPAFDVQPGQALYLAPKERVRVW